jgi:crossover junction endodeoxyribonuclease RuvC
MTSQMILAGIDPGLSGAVAFLDVATGAVLDIAYMPTLALSRGGKNKREVDAHALARLIGDRRPGHAFVELVGAMPGQGVSSVFEFGKSFGVVIGVLAALGIPFTLVAPVVWKRALGVPAAKDGARARASQLLPAAAHHWPLVKHDGRAEAALIAYYGLRQLGRAAVAA